MHVLEMEPGSKSNKDSVLLCFLSRPRCQILGPITSGQEIAVPQAATMSQCSGATVVAMEEV